MNRKQNWNAILILLSSTFFINGCSTIESTTQTVLQPVVKSSHELTVQTVEFSSNVSVTNVGVSIFDFSTGEKLASELVNNKGKATFKGVNQDQPYEIVIYRVLPTGEWLEQTRENIVFDIDNPLISIETFNSNEHNRLAVPLVKQYPELPNGCEVTALTAILNYYGLKVNKVDLSNNYLPKEPFIEKENVMYGPDPNIAYAGDPAQLKGGYYVFAPPIVEVANEVLFEQGSDYRAMNLSDATKNEIIDYVKSGVPVLAWVTIDLKKPRTNGYWLIEKTKEKHPIYMNLHAVVMTGYNNGKISVMNPLTGYETIDENTFFDSFKSLGSQAIVIL